MLKLNMKVLYKGDLRLLCSNFAKMFMEKIMPQFFFKKCIPFLQCRVQEQHID
jgi:hypothetical protein